MKQSRRIEFAGLELANKPHCIAQTKPEKTVFHLKKRMFVICVRDWYDFSKNPATHSANWCTPSGYRKQ